VLEVSVSAQVRYSLTEWIRANLPAGKRILELGSGDGTTGRLGLEYDVHSVEHSLRWLWVYHSHYIPTTMVNGWYDPTPLRALIPEAYDLLIVDGPVGDDRVNFIRHFDLFRRDVPIVVDDTERPGEREILRFLAGLGYVEVAWDRSEICKQWTALRPGP
jgi:hypothetical protein